MFAAPSQVWELSKCKLKTNHYGHTGYINTVTVSPDGSLCASGGKDGITMLWELSDGKHLYSLEAGDVVNALVFSPTRYWLCAATASCIKSALRRGWGKIVRMMKGNIWLT